jgi:hypothetical protein
VVARVGLAVGDGLGHADDEDLVGQAPPLGDRERDTGGHAPDGYLDLLLGRGGRVQVQVHLTERGCHGAEPADREPSRSLNRAADHHALMGIDGPVQPAFPDWQRGQVRGDRLHLALGIGREQRLQPGLVVGERQSARGDGVGQLLSCRVTLGVGRGERDTRLAHESKPAMCRCQSASCGTWATSE